VNVVDILAIALLILFAWIGARSGALRQLLGLAGAAAAIALVILAGPTLLTWAEETFPALEEWLAAMDTPLRAAIVLGLLLLTVVIGQSVGSSVGVALKSRLGYGGSPYTGIGGLLSRLDAVGGALLGIGQAVLLIWLVGGLLAAGSPRALAREAQRSTVLRTLSGVLPPPTTVAGAVAGLLDETGAPNPFTGLEPAPAPAVRGPTTAAARQIGTRAANSTVEVRGTGCGGINVGTGFSVSSGYITTNAHVVAGTRDLRVETQAGQELRATLVFFDPALDVALLRVPDFTGPALRFASRTPPRGTQGAALGHPRAQPLTIIPAAVAASYRAQGFDIYDRNTVSRDIVELRADVEPGDSGGPFVLADGTVGGVVFAASKGEEGVGYALAPDDVAAEILPAVGRTRAVPTGACVR
jgi:S1-C subfamily serine protease